MEDSDLRLKIENDKYILEDAQSSSVRSIYPIRDLLWCGNSYFCDKLLIAKSDEYDRMLFTDGELQSTSFDERIYHEHLVHPCLSIYYSLYENDNLNILILGGGEGSTTRELLRYPKNLVNKIVWIDIDKDLVNLCRNHLKYCDENVYNDDRVLLSYEDANNYLNSTLDKFDIVICDLPDPWINIGDGLYSNQFWNDVRKVSNDNHVIVSHLGPINPGKKHFQLCNDLLFQLKLDINNYKLGKIFIPSFMSEWLYIYFSFNKSMLNIKLNLDQLPINLSIIDKENIDKFFYFSKYYLD